MGSDKRELRKCEFTRNGKKEIGFFHRFTEIGNDAEGKDIYAVIEDETGYTTEYSIPITFKQGYMMDDYKEDHETISQRLKEQFAKAAEPRSHKIWIARDAKGSLYLYLEGEPTRNVDVWAYGGKTHLMLEEDDPMGDGVTWEGGPKKVYLKFFSCCSLSRNFK